MNTVESEQHGTGRRPGRSGADPRGAASAQGFPRRRRLLPRGAAACRQSRIRRWRSIPVRATALVGESGSGKTTVARMLALLYTPTSGTIAFQGKPVNVDSAARLHAYRRHVQMVFQDPFASLNPVHTVRYHLARPLRIYGHARSSAEVTAQMLRVARTG